MMINSKHVLKSILIQEEFKPALEFHKNQAYLFQLILTMETSKKMVLTTEVEYLLSC